MAVYIVAICKKIIKTLAVQTIQALIHLYCFMFVIKFTYPSQ